MEKLFVRGERPQKRAYSPAVITDGVGKIIWIAGHTGHVDDNGKSLAGDFDTQCRQTFRNAALLVPKAANQRRRGPEDGGASFVIVRHFGWSRRRRRVA
jgi:enamine deaminase RidA (YjgF/YER057c/UK114 family)